ncbi:hypothetical protein [Natronorubrum sp. FCH18a]|uniref:hypothetical protein n=1 Tax=Natronorubrum sp. FCH18a TaxID=3447018 RepID=UPI003F518E57
MNQLGDRLVILLIAATGFAVLIAGWAGGLVEAEAPIGWEIALIGGLFLLLILVLVGFWTEFSLIDRKRERDQEQDRPN